LSKIELEDERTVAIARSSDVTCEPWGERGRRPAPGISIARRGQQAIVHHTERSDGLLSSMGRASLAEAPSLAIMPTIRGVPGPYRLYFYSFDCNEPPHVHVQRERATAKFWLEPVVLAGNHGLVPRELSAARRVIVEHRHRILEAWHEHCGPTRE
jgi:hypothetical protein